MNQKIQLSIAIPVYNGEKNLKKQFNRIFNECDNVKFKNFLEIVISDNCSSDGTKKIVEYNKARSLKNKNLSIRYFRNNKKVIEEDYTNKKVSISRVSLDKSLIYFPSILNFSVIFNR